MTAAAFLASCGGGKRRARVDFAKLAEGLEGRVILPSDRAYTRARELWNTRYDGSRPRAVIQVANAGDVRKVRLRRTE